ncbi:hypothetical protein AXF42_Ash018317 [Apostasia shenzhenica]|uniref:Transcription termination factor MTEF1, chloroplastic n=1 Tax=Apostasia shenzhenica TaxID=1088818 RepID=A0A2H9ZR53_9ASPA|nr:hypothetical protein AXF42_Ash018317 [Apostasia shenzhenica]
MPAIRFLCLPSPSAASTASAGGGSATTSGQLPPNLSTKPTAPTLLKLTTPQAPPHHLLLPADLPSDVKEKILSLEIIGVDSARAVFLNPNLRSASPESVHSVISFLLSKGIHHKDLPRILGMCPKILTSNISGELKPVFSFLSGDLHVPSSHFRRVVNKCPRLLVSSVRDQLRPALLYLRRLGFKDTFALAYNDPILLVSSVEKTIIPKLEFLTAIGFSREEAAAMVLRCPGLLTFSIENNFKPKYEYFAKVMGGRLEELKEFPQYFAFSLEKRIKPRNMEMVKEAQRKLPLPLMLKTTDEEFRDLMMKRRKR